MRFSTVAKRSSRAGDKSNPANVVERRKQVTTGLIVAVITTAIALPLSLIHPILSFAILLIELGFLLLLQRWRWLPKLSIGYLAGFLIAIVVLLPATFLIRFAEQGFDDGPFYGQPLEAFLTEAEASDRLSYRQGELLIYNRQPDQAPVLAYSINGELQWAQAMDVRQNHRYEEYQLTALAEPTLAYGIFRDRLNFVGTWNFGAEPGRAFIWKWNGFHRFFLSW